MPLIGFEKLDSTGAEIADDDVSGVIHNLLEVATDAGPCEAWDRCVKRVCKGFEDVNATYCFKYLAKLINIGIDSLDEKGPRASLQAMSAWGEAVHTALESRSDDLSDDGAQMSQVKLS